MTTFFRQVNKKYMVVMDLDRNRVLVTAKKSPEGWRLKGYGLSFLAKGNQKNLLGFTNPDLMTVNINAARDTLRAIADEERY
tara:strand:+ start:8541 stop:8786 length:246 start_codon:yes stop_codon:yes gene_type:complete